MGTFLQGNYGIKTRLTYNTITTITPLSEMSTVMIGLTLAHCKKQKQIVTKTLFNHIDDDTSYL